MTDNEIIKALKYLRTSTLNGWCEKKITEKDLNTISYALDLINRQKAEIERLQKYNTEVAFKHYNDGKSEAIREFAKRYKNEINNRYEDIAYKDLFFKAIDNIVKEMTESEDEENGK